MGQETRRDGKAPEVSNFKKIGKGLCLSEELE
jgi:hypothetical protein